MGNSWRFLLLYNKKICYKMFMQEIPEALQEFLENEKLENICHYEAPANWITSAFVCTATSPRHIDAVADKLRRYPINGQKMIIDGEGEWVIASSFGYVVHLFTQPQREYYTLDELWKKTRREK